MKNYFNFYYFGLNAKVFSENKLFSKLVEEKFFTFKKKSTQHLLKGQIEVNFYNKNLKNNSDKLIIISSKVSKNDQKLFIKHWYLGADTKLEFIFKNKKLNKINFYFMSSWYFELVNFLLFNLLKRQLFQILIKLYLEQSLLYYLSRQKKLFVLHASALEKNGQILALAALNGVGKSTLALKLIFERKFNFYADNYLLASEKYAYFSPDRIRIGKKSLDFLNLKSSSKFAFQKFNLTLDKKYYSKLKKANFKKIYLLERADTWQLKKATQERIWKKIISRQIKEGEQIELAPISYFYDDFNLSFDKLPIAAYYDLSLGKLEDFESKIL